MIHSFQIYRVKYTFLLKLSSFKKVQLDFIHFSYKNIRYMWDKCLLFYEYIKSNIIHIFFISLRSFIIMNIIFKYNEYICLIEKNKILNSFYSEFFFSHDIYFFFY